MPSVQASAAAEVAIGIPGTVFPLVAAMGVPVIGCIDPGLEIPEYLRRVCSDVVTDPAAAVAAVDGATPLDDNLRDEIIGPVGGSARRLFDRWAEIV